MTATAERVAAIMTDAVVIAVDPIQRRKHGPNITVSYRKDKRPRTFSHARLAVDQGKADILALRQGMQVGHVTGSVSTRRSERDILASLSAQLDEIRRYLDGE